MLKDWLLKAPWMGAARGLALSVIYCLYFLSTWFLSVDQWYLPAGIRAAALLFVPMRYWPFLFLGDTAALLWLRLPMIETAGATWVFVSSTVAMPAMSALVFLIRRRLGDIGHRQFYIPFVILCMAAFGAVVGSTVNFALSPPSGFVFVPKEAVKYAIGDFLGMLMVILPVTLWKSRSTHLIVSLGAWRDTVIAGLVVASVTIVSYRLSGHATEFRQALLLLLLVPAVGLTFLHGWRGAALGILVVNLGTALSSPNENSSGSFDPQAFIAQEALAIAAVALLTLGAAISHHSRRARLRELSERQAMQLAKTSFQSTERSLRERALHAAEIKESMNATRRALIQLLRESGHHAAAMDAMREGVLQSRIFDTHASALYPIDIEASGLYVVLQSSALQELWGHGVNVTIRLRGNSQLLGVSLQLAAYRCACDAVAIISESVPEVVYLRARCGTVGDRRGIVLTVSHEQASQPLSATAEVALMDIESRAKAHGGIVKLHKRGRLSILLAEPTMPHSVGELYGLDTRLRTHRRPDALSYDASSSSAER